MKKILLLVLAAAASMPLWSVTDREMDQARAIAAKYYLRWANNGSGYLDDVNPASMAELNAALKAKEKENIKAFNAIKVPPASEYASWTKEKLAEYWGVEAFKSPGLSAEGRGGRTKARKKILDMKVAPPSATPAPQTTPQPEPETPQPVETDATVADTIIGTMADADPQGAAEDILKDQKQIEKDARDAEMKEPEQSHTWVYILVLAILVGVVIWLVVYAANLMKRQPGASGNDDEGDSELREQAKKAIAKKNEELENLHRRLEAEENRSADLGAELEKLRLECKRKDERIAMLREENVTLRNNAQQQTRTAPRRQMEDSDSTQVRSEGISERPASSERPAGSGTRQAAEQVLKVIYLGRANARGIFVRADRKINAGNTIYRLDTNDGLVGTFHVVDEPEIVEVAVSNPTEYLGNGCICNDLEDTLGVTRIVTESAGTAIFENGYWKVLRKTKVRYE